jgi:hypothetical protein
VALAFPQEVCAMPLEMFDELASFHVLMIKRTLSLTGIHYRPKVSLLFFLRFPAIPNIRNPSDLSVTGFNEVVKVTRHSSWPAPSFLAKEASFLCNHYLLE